MIKPSLIFLAFFLYMIGFQPVPLEARQGGTVEGFVLNPNNEPLPGVHISLPELQTGTSSDRNGKFQISNIPSGEHILQASMVGFRTFEQIVRIDPGQTTSLRVELEAYTFQSGELVITASRQSRLIGKVAVSMNTITPEELSSRNILSLDNALGYVPGVHVLGNSVNIRGSSGFSYGVGSRVLLLVDGVPMMGPDQGSMDFEGLPFTQTRQIEVLKSPGSALYGGGALGGVVNIITRDFPETPENTIRMFGGVYQPVRFEEWRTAWDKGDQYRPLGGVIFGRSHQASNRFGYWFSAALREDTGYLQNSGSRTAELFTKLGWNMTDNASLILYSSARRAQNEQFLYWGGLDDVLRPGSISLDGSTAAGGNDGLSDRLTILPVFSHSVHPDFSYTLKGRLFGVAFRPLDDEGNIRPSRTHTYGVRYGGEAQADYNPLENLVLTGGFSYDANYVESEVFIADDSLTVRNQPEGAFFLQAEYNWNPKLTTTVGFRYDAYQIHTLDTATQFSPKFSFSYAVSNALTARASFGKGFRVPSVAERFVSNRDFLPLESNLELRPETSTGYEAGVTLNTLAGNRFSLSAEMTGFLNEYSDLVEPRFVASEAAFQFINVTEARIKGLETTLTFADLHIRQQLRLSYTFLNPMDLELNEPLLFRSSHLFQASARSNLLHWLEAGADFRAASAPERIDTDFSIFVNDADVFPATYVADARLKVTIPQTHNGLDINASFIVRNLFDYYYVERPAYFAPPRNYQIVLELNF